MNGNSGIFPSIIFGLLTFCSRIWFVHDLQIPILSLAHTRGHGLHSRPSWTSTWPWWTEDLDIIRKNREEAHWTKLNWGGWSTNIPQHWTDSFPFLSRKIIQDLIHEMRTEINFPSVMEVVVVFDENQAHELWLTHKDLRSLAQV